MSCCSKVFDVSMFFLCFTVRRGSSEAGPQGGPGGVSRSGVLNQLSERLPSQAWPVMSCAVCASVQFCCCAVVLLILCQCCTTGLKKETELSEAERLSSERLKHDATTHEEANLNSL